MSNLKKESWGEEFVELWDNLPDFPNPVRFHLIKSFIKELLASQREEVVEEIKDKVQNLTIDGEFNSPGLMGNLRMIRWLDLEDLLNSLSPNRRSKRKI